MAVTNIAASLDDQMIRKMVLPKTKTVFERNCGDLKLTLNVLACLAQVIDRLDKSAIIDDVLPLLWDVKLQDPEIIQEVVSKSAAVLVLVNMLYTVQLTNNKQPPMLQVFING